MDYDYTFIFTFFTAICSGVICYKMFITVPKEIEARKKVTKIVKRKGARRSSARKSGGNPPPAGVQAIANAPSSSRSEEAAEIEELRKKTQELEVELALLKSAESSSSSVGKMDEIALTIQKILFYVEAGTGVAAESPSSSVNLPRNPVFMFTLLSASEKTHATELIKRLGGSVSNLLHFNPACTVLVAKNLIRSEKVLGCIAAGKFVLKYSYLVKCDEEGRFVPVDETHLWQESDVVNDKEKAIARASFKWIKAQMADKNKRPMANMKFYFYQEREDRLQTYVRLVEAGGGEVVDSIEEATIVITEEKLALSVPAGTTLQSGSYLSSLILAGPLA